MTRIELMKAGLQALPADVKLTLLSAVPNLKAALRHAAQAQREHGDEVWARGAKEIGAQAHDQARRIEVILAWLEAP